MPPPESRIRPLVRALRAYVPGEQPKIKGLIKLNTNENAYPPSPRVLKTLRAAVDARLRLYPNPSAERLRAALARRHRCKPEQILVGNGSDECLALAVRAFVEPAVCANGKGEGVDPRTLVQYLTPSYSLYPVLADAHGAVRRPVSLRPDFGLPSAGELERGGVWRPDAALTFITTPNAPSGRGYAVGELDAMCGALQGVVVLDEAYVDFAAGNALSLALSHPHVLVARTFSKAYSLCFLRVGYLVGHPELIAALDKIRDSYNVNGLAQIAAVAALGDRAYYRRTFRRIVATRGWLTRELARLGFEALPSETNFVFARPPKFAAEEWLARLRRRRILVRWFDSPEVSDYLRITIGTERDMKVLVRTVKEILLKN